MRLVEASLNPPAGLVELLAEIGGGENGFGGTPVTTDPASLRDYLVRCMEGADPARVSPGLVPQTIFWVLDDRGVAAGMVRMRHFLNDKLLIRGGHIGYYIRRDCRGKGYAKEALRLALRELYKVGARRALLTALPDNAASIQVIEANGGRFEDERVDPDSGKVHRRYWIEMDKERT